MKKLILVLVVIFIGGLALAQTPSPSPSPMAQVVDTLQKVDQGIPVAEGALLATILVVLGILAKVFPVVIRWILLLPVLGLLLKTAGSILTKSGTFLETVGKGAKAQLDAQQKPPEPPKVA